MQSTNTYFYVTQEHEKLFDSSPEYGPGLWEPTVDFLCEYAVLLPRVGALRSQVCEASVTHNATLCLILPSLAHWDPVPFLGALLVASMGLATMLTYRLIRNLLNNDVAHTSESTTTQDEFEDHGDDQEEGEHEEEVTFTFEIEPPDRETNPDEESLR